MSERMLLHYATMVCSRQELDQKLVTTLIMLRIELLKAVPRRWIAIALTGPLPFTEGEYFCFNDDHKKCAKLVRPPSPLAGLCTVEVLHQSAESFLYSACEPPLIRIVTDDRLMRLHTSTCPKFKRLRSHGPVEATWPPPDLFHLKLKGSSEQAGTLLTTTSSQNFYKMLLALKPMSSSKKPVQVQKFSSAVEDGHDG